MFAHPTRINAGADGCDDSGSLMSQHDRHRIDQLALDDLQVSMAQTCSGNSHQDFPSARLFGLYRSIRNFRPASVRMAARNLTVIRR